MNYILVKYFDDGEVLNYALYDYNHDIYFSWYIISFLGMARKDRSYTYFKNYDDLIRSGYKILYMFPGRLTTETLKEIIPEEFI